MEEKIRKGLFVFILLVLLAPLVQYCLPYITSGPLHGYFTNAEDVNFSWDKWLDGTYQEQKGAYYNDHTGFRPDLVRLSSQVDFSILRKVPYGGTTLGPDNTLYYDNYIDAYYGEDFIGYPAIKKQLLMLKAVQDTLARLNKSLILVHAPSKAFYNAGTVPDLNKCTKNTTNNFEVFVRLGDSLGINQLDVNSWFISMKSKTKHLLFSKQGIHWTVYGAIVAADSIIRYTEQLRGIKMVHPVWSEVERTPVARETDDDIGRVLNFIFPVAEELYSYPVLQYPVDSSAKKLNTILLGDSFTWTLITSGIANNTTSRWEFWDYFKLVHRSGVPDKKMEEYNWKEALNKADCIVLVYTSINLHQLGNGFIEQAYAHYFPARKGD